MPNGEMMEQIKEMVESGDIDIIVATKFLLTASIENIDDHEQFKTSLVRIANSIEDINVSFSDMKTSMCVYEKKRLRNNPMINVGVFIREYPIPTKILFYISVIILTLWSIPGVRRLVLGWINVDPTLIQFLSS